MKNKIKKIIFSLIVIVLIMITLVIVKNGKFEALEGYMYSLAADIVDNATSSNATSSNATSSNATSSNATSSNATSSNATSSNATSPNATSSNATSSSATSSNVTSTNTASDNTIKVTNKTEEKANTQKETNNSLPTEKVKENSKKDLQYANSKITEEILKEIIESEDTQNVIIDIDNDVIVEKEIFKAIQGKEKQLTINIDENQIIFNGKDIQQPKDIDVSITYNLINEDSELKEIAEKGIVINFANNGELPGKAKVRIKLTDEIKAELDLETIFVYYYNENEKELVQLDKAVYNEEGFIEISIDHNSKYIFVNEQIEEKTELNNVIANEVENEVSFLESHKMYILIIGISVLTIIIVTVILIVDKKTKGKARPE